MGDLLSPIRMPYTPMRLQRIRRIKNAIARAGNTRFLFIVCIITRWIPSHWRCVVLAIKNRGCSKCIYWALTTRFHVFFCRVNINSYCFDTLQWFKYPNNRCSCIWRSGGALGALRVAFGISITIMSPTSDNLDVGGRRSRGAVGADSNAFPSTPLE